MNDTTSRSTMIVTVGIIICVAIAVTALALAIIAVNKNQTDSKRIAVLQAQLRSASPTLSEASNGLTAERTKLKALEGKVAKLSPEIASIENCLPELQSELGSLEIKGETYGASYINNPAHTSLACNKILYASAR